MLYLPYLCLYSTDIGETEYCQCPANYTGVDCSVLTACGDNCEYHEICVQADPYPECKGKNVYLSMFFSLKFEEIDRSRLEDSQVQ